MKIHDESIINPLSITFHFFVFSFFQREGVVSAAWCQVSRRSQRSTTGTRSPEHRRLRCRGGPACCECRPLHWKISRASPALGNQRGSERISKFLVMWESPGKATRKRPFGIIWEWVLYVRTTDVWQYWDGLTLASPH